MISDLDKVGEWAYGDFARPLIKYAEGKYPEGRFFYVEESSFVKENDTCVQVVSNLKCDEKLCNELGAPRKIQTVYTLRENGLKVSVSWLGKDANRLTEAIFMHVYPSDGELMLEKLGGTVDPDSVVSKGSRNLHAVKKAVLTTENGRFEFVNRHAPLISVGKGKILEFDNKLEKHEHDGVSYVLYNNVWGTNFPLWYEDNARFEFEITK